MTGLANSAILKPFLALAEPQLFVSDIKASCAFHMEKLGFKIGFVYGEPPFYAQVRRDGARLNFGTSIARCSTRN